MVALLAWVTRSIGGLLSSVRQEPSVVLRGADVTVPQLTVGTGTVPTVEPPVDTPCQSHPIRATCPELSGPPLETITGLLAVSHQKDGCQVFAEPYPGLMRSRYQGQLLCPVVASWNTPLAEFAPLRNNPAPTPPGGFVTFCVYGKPH